MKFDLRACCHSANSVSELRLVSSNWWSEPEQRSRGQRQRPGLSEAAAATQPEAIQCTRVHSCVHTANWIQQTCQKRTCQIEKNTSKVEILCTFPVNNFLMVSLFSLCSVYPEWSVTMCTPEDTYWHITISHLHLPVLHPRPRSHLMLTRAQSPCHR